MPGIKIMYSEILYMISEYRRENALKNGEFIGWMLFAGLSNMFLLHILAELGIIEFIKP